MRGARCSPSPHPSPIKGEGVLKQPFTAKPGETRQGACPGRSRPVGTLPRPSVCTHPRVTQVYRPPPWPSIEPNPARAVDPPRDPDYSGPWPETMCGARSLSAPTAQAYTPAQRVRRPAAQASHKPRVKGSIADGRNAYRRRRHPRQRGRRPSGRPRGSRRRRLRPHPDQGRTRQGRRHRPGLLGPHGLSRHPPAHRAGRARCLAIPRRGHLSHRRPGLRRRPGPCPGPRRRPGLPLPGPSGRPVRQGRERPGRPVRDRRLPVRPRVLHGAVHRQPHPRGAAGRGPTPQPAHPGKRHGDGPGAGLGRPGGRRPPGRRPTRPRRRRRPRHRRGRPGLRGQRLPGGHDRRRPRPGLPCRGGTGEPGVHPVRALERQDPTRLLRQPDAGLAAARHRRRPRVPRRLLPRRHPARTNLQRPLPQGRLLARLLRGTQPRHRRGGLLRDAEGPHRVDGLLAEPHGPGPRWPTRRSRGSRPSTGRASSGWRSAASTWPRARASRSPPRASTSRAASRSTPMPPRPSRACLPAARWRAASTGRTGPAATP